MWRKCSEASPANRAHHGCTAHETAHVPQNPRSTKPSNICLPVRGRTPRGAAGASKAACWELARGPGECRHDLWWVVQSGVEATILQLSPDSWI